MSAIDSRPGRGTLTLGTDEFGTQISNVLLEPTHSKEDGVPTLGDPTPSPTVTTTWALKGDGIQDWQLDDGFVEFCRANNGAEVAFELVLNEDLDVIYSGTCIVYAVAIGGTVKARNTSAFEFDVVGDPERSGGTATPSAPTNLTGDAESATVAVLDWSEPALGGPFTSYKVYKASTENGVYTEVTTNITKTGTTARVSSLTTATTSWFKVAAVNANGTGTQSAAVSVTQP